MTAEKERTDFFTEMMLGKKTEVIENREKILVESVDSTENSSHQDWLFGRRSSHHSEELPLPSFLKNNSVMNMLENIDYVELMHHIDTLTATTSELKPLFKKIKPFIEALIEKNK